SNWKCSGSSARSEQKEARCRDRAAGFKDYRDRGVKMARQYAIVSDTSGEILFQTPGFAAAVTERLALPERRTLLLMDQELERINRELTTQLREAQDANTAKEVFLSNMSHDIRTPMNAIIGMTALAKKHIDEKSRVMDSLNKIEVASAHLLSLINEVLDMSRINSGRMAVENSLFSLGDLLHDTLVIVRPQLQQKGHTFSFRADQIEYESLYGDVTRLRQIFVNILNNAIKYTADGGTISVTVSEQVQGDRCRLCFRCRDNGIGMSQTFLEKIFDPFERANTSTISKIEGTGLGMSIVKKLIDAMSGTIAIESREGSGTTVTIGIPLAYETIGVDTSALEHKKVLILEADEELRETFSRYLSEFGVAFSLVSSSEEAVAALTEAEFRGENYSGILIGKTVAHVGSLFDLASYLHKANPALPIILVSEENWSEIEYRANRSGIDHFVPIPVFRKALINSLNDVLLQSGDHSSHAASPDLTGKHILLVEDNFINREIACELLGATNAQIDTAEDGQQAVTRFLDSRPGWYDLILMDIQMPVMDGYEATRQIRASGREDSETVRIFAMTANIFAEDIAKSRGAGMNGHLAKPIDVNKLMQVLRQIL
ncbi:MAG: response regulator, partial [Oscillospiraceae bacterium]|nr:response regulator [Oscillospiraceae bacterium]